MKPIALFRRTALALLLGLGALSAHAAALQPITLDADALAHARTRVAARDARLLPAHAKLMEHAEALLKTQPESVTYKKLAPPSGDRHDYMSLAPYWWPDPSRPDGLPYVQRDGQFNPSAKNGDTDSVRMQIMCLGVQNLSVAWYFSRDARYARKAADYIRTWFLDPATRMNPNLRYGQAVMGRVDGRGIGLIDTRNLWMVIDAVALLEPAQVLSTAEVEALRAWFRTFTDWMLNDPLGVEEFNAHNNHGTFYDMQIASYALFSGDRETARRAVERGVDLRIASQISIEGKQYAELERTTPFHYSAFNLDAMTHLARYGELLGVDVWKKRERTRGLRNGINYLARYADKPASWPWRELNGHPESELALSVMLRAERAYGGSGYGRVAMGLPVTSFQTQEYIGLAKLLGTEPPTTLNVIDRLLWPIRTADAPAP
ncbi:MAG: alginate lyase family protein [Candidatus Dactylopiibacterium sp.]|nr:alginate lyase family protein [Candidatus Dactylopiibacterium sp.]